MCGKKFIPTPEWVYKNRYGVFCKWSCLRKWEVENERKTGAKGRKAKAGGSGDYSAEGYF
jgi:hypothetical protein